MIRLTSTAPLLGLTFSIPSSLANLAPADTGVVIFAPTNKPQGSCLEMTPIYQRLPGSSATSHSFGWYDWCQFPPQWTLIESMQDPFWLSDYAITAYWPPEGQYVDEIYWGLTKSAATAGRGCSSISPSAITSRKRSPVAPRAIRRGGACGKAITYQPT